MLSVKCFYAQSRGCQGGLRELGVVPAHVASAGRCLLYDPSPVLCQYQLTVRARTNMMILCIRVRFPPHIIKTSMCYFLVNV
jgi:hypothetical protein